MPRFYVEHKGKWNIYSIDGYSFNDFVEFKELKEAVIGEMVVEKMRNLTRSKRQKKHGS